MLTPGPKSQRWPRRRKPRLRLGRGGGECTTVLGFMHASTFKVLREQACVYVLVSGLREPSASVTEGAGIPTRGFKCAVPERGSRA